MRKKADSKQAKVIPKREWIKNIVERCQADGIPVFMKSSLLEIWGDTLIQEFPKFLVHGN